MAAWPCPPTRLTGVPPHKLGTHGPPTSPHHSPPGTCHPTVLHWHPPWALGCSVPWGPCLGGVPITVSLGPVAPGQTAHSEAHPHPCPPSTGHHCPSPGLSPATSVVFYSRSTLCSSALLGSEAGAWLPPSARVVPWGCSFVSQANIFLRVLDISYNGCGDSGASAVGEVLKTNNVLEELYMR